MSAIATNELANQSADKMDLVGVAAPEHLSIHI